MRTLEQLIGRGIVALGKKAKGNPEAFSRGSFAIGVANKDYAAATPLLWNSAYGVMGLDAENVRLVGDPERAGEIFDALKADDRYLGGDVGVGFKDKAWTLFDAIDPLAKEMQSVNVVVKTSEGSLKGYNTDGIGYSASLENMLGGRGEKLRGGTVIVLGGGGTANSIAFALAMRGAKVVVLNRTAEKARALAARVNAFFASASAAYGGGRDELARFAPQARAIVSVIDDPKSPLDQYSVLGTIELPVTAERIRQNLRDAREMMGLLKPDTIISDVMLREKPTATLREAALAGFPTLDGRPMVLNQAIEAFMLVNEPLLRGRKAGKAEVARIMEAVRLG